MFARLKLAEEEGRPRNKSPGRGFFALKSIPVGRDKGEAGAGAGWMVRREPRCSLGVLPSLGGGAPPLCHFQRQRAGWKGVEISCSLRQQVGCLL